MQRIPASLAIACLLLAVGIGACSVEASPTAGVRANRRGDAVIVAPRCTDERIAVPAYERAVRFYRRLILDAAGG